MGLDNCRAALWEGKERCKSVLLPGQVSTLTLIQEVEGPMITAEVL